MSVVEDLSPTLLSDNEDSRPDPPAIHIHVQLPTGTQTIDEGVLEWTWMRTLQVPMASLLRIAPLHPWRWILFACGVLMGTAGGTLHTSDDLDDGDGPIDLDDRPPTDNAHIYFHVLEEDREKLIPVEPDLRNSSRTGSASGSVQLQELKERLASRDKACVVSGVDFLDICTAAHLIPRVKTDVYIENVTRRHVERGYPGAQLVTDIDDARNAILVAASIHACLGKSVAIMKLPNFAFPSPDKPERWEFHVLNDAALASMALSSAPHGKAIAVPDSERRATWPPSALFDQVYASAVFNCFNTKDKNVKKSLRDMSSSYYGPAGPLSDVQHVDADADADKDEEDEKIPEFAIWQRLLPPDTQHRVYAALLQKGQEKARAASSQRVLEWRRHVE